MLNYPMTEKGKIQINGYTIYRLNQRFIPAISLKHKEIKNDNSYLGKKQTD